MSLIFKQLFFYIIAFNGRDKSNKKDKSKSKASIRGLETLKVDDIENQENIKAIKYYFRI